MDGLVVYYSRTGNTEDVGEQIARRLDCETLKVSDKKERSGVTGYLKGGWDAWRGKKTEIEMMEEDISDRDLIIVGTPVWAGNPSPAVRTYLSRKKSDIDDIAFYCTCGGSGYEGTFEAMEKITGKEPLATVVVKEKRVKEGNYEGKIGKFLEKITKKIEKEKNF
ncbi:MAG: flavodoxin [Candidatus Thermoplasmatota archaeon]|nr:flavodoxin [Candidatus Thermoplasmatota archaeon]